MRGGGCVGRRTDCERRAAQDGGGSFDGGDFRNVVDVYLSGALSDGIFGFVGGADGIVHRSHVARGGACGRCRQCDGEGDFGCGHHREDDSGHAFGARVGGDESGAGAHGGEGGCCAGREQAAAGEITIPWFAFGFLAVIGFNSLDWLPAPVVDGINNLDTFMLTMAMTALGTETSIEKFKRAGAKPFVLAAILYVWLLVGGYLLVKYGIG